MGWWNIQKHKWRWRKNRYKRNLQTVRLAVEPYTPAAIVGAAWVLILALLWPYAGDIVEIEEGIYIEAWGTLFDIFVIVLILGWFQLRREKKQHIERYEEEIDDFKRWDTDEARVRIAGNLRRLAKLGKTDVNLSGVILRDFSFFAQKITKLRGAKFSTETASWIADFSTVLERVDLSHADCTGTTFSRFLLSPSFGTKFSDVVFANATLVNASFEGATMVWTNPRPNEDDWHEIVDEETGDRAQTYWPPFEDADLAGASFRRAMLKNADFRNAKNVEFANFEDTKGLETCLFDEGVREKLNHGRTVIVVPGDPPVIITTVEKEPE